MRIENDILKNVKDEDIKNGSFVIPDNVTSIDFGAFSDCESLTNITIGDNVTIIKKWAFEYCPSLKSKEGNYKAVMLEGKRLLNCIGSKYKENRWTSKVSEKKIREKGYYYCTNLFDVFNYYGGKLDADVAIFECEVGDKVIENGWNSERCTNRIKLTKRLYRDDVIKILNDCKRSK